MYRVPSINYVNNGSTNIRKLKKAYQPDFTKFSKRDLDYSIQLAQDNLNELKSEVEKTKS